MQKPFYVLSTSFQKPDPEKRMMVHPIFKWKQPMLRLVKKCRKCKKLKGKAKNVIACKYVDAQLCKNVKKLQEGTPTPTLIDQFKSLIKSWIESLIKTVFEIDA